MAVIQLEEHAPVNGGGKTSQVAAQMSTTLLMAS